MGFEAAMRAMMSGHVAAFEACDAAGCAAIYADDAAVFSPFGPPLRGRAAIKAAHLDRFEEGERNKRIDLLDCAASGDLGYCLIAYGADVEDTGGGTRRVSGTNLMAMVRGATGWRIRHSSMNELPSD